MIEIPESATISLQAESILTGKRIAKVIKATSPHRFTWYNGNPALYRNILVGREIESARGHGAFVDILCDNDTYISISDGTNLKYYTATEKYPVKHQLLILFEDKTCLAFTVSMYGSIFAYKGQLQNVYHTGSLNSISPLNDAFNEAYFDSIFASVQKDMSVKALLGTLQRIPGLGNGVLQDIFFKAGIHPKRRISTMSDLERGDLFHSLKVTLCNMTDKGVRDTEKDFYGNWGKYRTLLSKKTYKEPCPICGSNIVKEAYLGGTIYFCPSCQKE